MRIGKAALVLLLAWALAGCAVSSGARGPSLYDALGGLAGIEAVTDGLLRRVAGDPTINHHFANTDMQRLRARLVEQLCAESGGPCVYGGEPMDLAHAGRDISDAEFDALVAHLEIELITARVDAGSRRALLTHLGGLRGQIVGQ